MLKNIIYEDENIIVVFKPAGIATQTARLGQQDMVSELKNYLAGRSGSRGKCEPYVGLVHRLDQPVSGMLVFAKTRQAASGLGRQITGGQMEKYYYAVICGAPRAEQGRLKDFLYKDGRTNMSLITEGDFPGAKLAVLEYRLIKTLVMLGEEDALPENEAGFLSREVSLMEIKLITGRHHQIRVQMSHADMPLLGDSKYGSLVSRELSDKAGCRSVALCAYKLILNHPVSGKKMIFEKQPEEEIFLPFFTNGI